jgi:hypothetical protein
MSFILCPYCHARIEFYEPEASEPAARLSAFCTDCREAFYFEPHDVAKEHEPETAV